MVKEEAKNLEFSFIEVLKFSLKWKWHIITATLIAGIAAAIFTGPAFITPLFESEVIFYPSTNNSISAAILSDATFKEKDVLEFGEEAQAEQALQILGSSTLMDKVVKEFDLMNHYGIDPQGSYPYTKLQRKIKSNIKFRRTELLSIEIKVRDREPKMAAKMANYISDILDSIKTDIQRQVAYKAFEIIEGEYLEKIKEVETLQRAINDLSAGKGVDAEIISNPFSRKNKKAARQDALQTLGTAKSNSNLGTLLSLTEALSLEVENLSKLKQKYERTAVDIREYLPQKFVISPASPAESKIYPVRFLLVAITMASVFIFSIIVILFTEKLKASLKAIKADV